MLPGSLGATQEAFTWLDAPITRLATADCPVPYSAALMSNVIPSAALIRAKIGELLRY